MQELWKPIKNYEGLYEISNLGNVKALNFHREKKEKLLKPKIDKYGYLCVRLSKNGKLKDFSIHRLVANAFIGESDLTVNHKDKNKQNNNIKNLEYMTNKDNVRYSQATKIKATNIKTKKILYFNSQKEVNDYGFQQGNVWKCLHGINKQHKGYVWELNEKEGD